MATVTDVEVANASFPTVRQDLNDILEAVATNFSADTEPTTTYANQWWYETDTDKLYIRNEANDAWIHVLTLDQTGNTVSEVQGAGGGDNIAEGNSSVEVIDTGTGYIQFNVDGAEIARIDSSGMKFGDNEKAIFGAGGDLEIYHDGSNTFINDVGTGNLIVRGVNVTIQDSTTKQYFSTDESTGASTLYHNSNSKLATTSTGVSVTGSLGINESSPSAPLHITTTSQGTLPALQADADNLLIEDQTSGITLMGATNGGGMIAFGDTDDADIGRIFYYHPDNAMRFWTNAAERMRIDSNGHFLVGKTSFSASNVGFQVDQGNGRVFCTSGDGEYPLYLNRTVNDGVLLHFAQDGTIEGNVSVSGTTVSYNGGHLARWSRLADDSKDTSIVKGTVMTNIDAMVEWSHETTYWTEDDELPVDEDGNPTVAVGDVKKEAYTEDNEQLNKMAVSSIEGDANVAGVFVNWDDDDEFNDMNIAMTGDMVIRIAEGVTVERGDLLMSAGDGTAKPQDDDIVRSKTIAKVTSTHVSHTYDDGSYLVPCVLMAC